MRQKHVTINALSPSAAPSPNSPTSPNRDLAPNDGTTTPIHRLSCEDGCRTPTIEIHRPSTGDIERNDHALGTLSNNSSHHRLPHTHHGIFGRASANVSVISFSERLLEKLQWRERIRHYTWTFFTMTMATGGIANVLYTGMRKAWLNCGNVAANTESDKFHFGFAACMPLASSSCCSTSSSSLSIS